MSTPSLPSAVHATGLTCGLTVNPAIEYKLIENEIGAIHLTDDQLLAWLQSEFPSVQIAVNDVDELRRRRHHYNVGSGNWSKRGPAGQDRPVSKEYDHNGQVINRPYNFKTPKTVMVTQNIVGVTEERVVELIGQHTPALSEDKVRELIQETVTQPVVYNITIQEKQTVKIEGNVHKAFGAVMQRVAAGLPVLLVGPAGSGKTYLASQIAKALNQPFTFNSMSEGISESSLLGRTLPTDTGAWVYKPAPFVTSYTQGGVHLLDEIDASDPNLLVQINAAIANGLLSIPFADQAEPFKRHKDSVIIAAANTFGHGADRQYVGRNQLDAATINRFTMGTVEVDYDVDVEKKLAWAIVGEKAQPLLDWAWTMRSRINAAKLRRIMSTRNIEDGAKLLKVGATVSDIKAIYMAGWTKDELTKVGL